jgi:Phycobilisome protein
MLVSAQLSGVPTVERLVPIWADRYLPDLSLLPIGDDALIRRQLREAALSSGRAQMVAKLNPGFVEDQCKLAALRVRDLYQHLPQVCDFMEAVRLSQFASRIYLKLLEVYQESPETTPQAELEATFGNSSLAAWGIPKIDKLAHLLEPFLLDFQEQHFLAKNWRTLGFITTQINFSNALLLEPLTPAEQVLISPYFSFVEEQVALPWQRICAAAASHDLHAPAFLLVEQMLPVASQISAVVYERLQQAFPNHVSRRGTLSLPAIRHSCLRDFDMFQAYLWLCVLQGSSKVIEQELLALCIMVLECVDVSWQTTVRATELLMEEILTRLNADQRALVKPYTEGMVQTFHHGYIAR